MTAAEMDAAVRSANRISQRFEAENLELRALVKELEQALNIWADAVDDSELTDLIERARRACR